MFSIGLLQYTNPGYHNFLSPCELLMTLGNIVSLKLTKVKFGSNKVCFIEFGNIEVSFN